MRRVLLSLAVCLALGSGCIEDLQSPAEVDRPRVLALRASPQGEPAVAWPEPGETVLLEWLAVEPGPVSPAVQWSFEACRVAPGRVGAGACAEPAFTELGGRAGAGEPARQGLAIPGSLSVEDAVLLRGIVCAGEGRCADGEEGATPWRFLLELASREEAHRHPVLSEVTLAGAPWTAEVDVGCGDAAVRIPAGSGARRIEVRRGEMDPGGDELQVAHHATAGDFDAYFAFIPEVEMDVEGMPSEANWTPPSADQVPDGELAVQFWLVVLDGKGGATWRSRSLCVVR